MFDRLLNTPLNKILFWDRNVGTGNVPQIFTRAKFFNELAIDKMKDHCFFFMNL